MPKHPPWFKAKERIRRWSAPVMTTLQGRERGAGATGRCPDRPESLVGSGSPTPLQAGGEGQPKENPQCWRQRMPGERPGRGTRAKAQGRGTEIAAGALECSQRRGLCRVPWGGRTGDSAGPRKPSDSDTVGMGQEAGGRRPDLGSAMAPHGCKAPWALVGWATPPGARVWGFR